MVFGVLWPATRPSRSCRGGVGSGCPARSEEGGSGASLSGAEEGAL
jgi:hypothetical protein